MGFDHRKHKQRTKYDSDRGPGSFNSNRNEGHGRHNSSLDSMKSKPPYHWFFKSHTKQAQEAGNRFNGPFKKKYNDPESFWYKVVIPQGARSSKEFIFNAIRELTGTSIITYNFHVDGNCMMFFIQGSSNVDTIKACSRRIYDKRSQALNINVSRSQLNNPQLDKIVEDNILEAMKRRYNTAMNFLDLSNFANESGLQEMSLSITLSKQPLLLVVVKKIKEHFSNVVFLSLAGNELSSLEPLSTLYVVKTLKALDLSNNKIRKLEELTSIKRIELEELVLVDNPVYTTHQNPNSIDVYISSIRSRFSKLTKLDGKEFSPIIKFDVGESTSLPPSLGSFVPLDIKEFVAEFLQQYFTIYDSDDRQPLIAAYHDQAIFSYSIRRTNKDSQFFPQSSISNSRNLLKVKDKTLRIKLLHQGGVAVVAALNELPKTKHVASSLLVDVPFHDSNFYSIVVNGVYKEFSKKQVYTRAFSRNFLIIPHGQGFVIINDILLLTNATPEQIQKYGRLNESRSILDCIKSESFSVPNFSRLSLTEQSATMSEMDKESIITQFCNATRMNRAFSAQCLEENGYDANQALNVFNQLNQNSAIPPEAFIQ